MATSDMIDLVSSDDEHSPQPNRKRPFQNEEVLSVCSSPSLSPARNMGRNSREKQEQLDRARQWSNDRKRRANNNNQRGSAADSNLNAPSRNNNEVVNLSSPTTSPNRKMSQKEKADARNRAQRWYENRQGRNNTDNSDDEEVVNLSSDDSSSPIRYMGSRNQRTQNTSTANDTSNVAIGGRHSQQGGGPSSSHAARSFNATAVFAGGGASGRRGRGRRNDNTAKSTTGGTDFSSSRGRRGRGTSTHTAAAAASQRGSRDEQRQWNCPRCTLLNAHHLSTCAACHHGNPSRPSNTSGMSSASRGGGAYFPSAMGRDVVSEMARAYRAPSGSSGGGYGRGSRSGAEDSESAILARLLGFQSQRHTGSVFGRHHGGAPRDSIDNMSYEQLLERFGDGSENRGASSGAISSLPVSKVGDPKNLPEDKRQCSICLEDFETGDDRTSLPCLHGFHTECVNRWLKSNGICPVCKTSVSTNGR